MTPVWEPLEMFCRLFVAQPHVCEPQDFMYMGVGYQTSNDATSGRTPEERKIHLYKHCDTRNYVNLDAGGHTYAHTGSSHWYRPTPVTEAYKALDLGMFDK